MNRSTPPSASDAQASVARAKQEKWDREVALKVGDLFCPACVRHAEEALRRVPGVRAASVARGGELARILYDVRCTSVREIVAAMGRAGFQLTAPEIAPFAEASPSTVGLGICLVTFANLLALSIASGPGPRPLSVGIAQLCLSLVVLAIGGVPIVKRACTNRRRGVVDRDALTVAAALIAFVAGVLQLGFAHRGAQVLPTWLAVLGFETARWQTAPTWGFESAAAIVLAARIVRAASVAIRRRALRDVVARERGGRVAARRLEPDGSEQPVSCDTLVPGDRVRLLEGERAPADVHLDASARVIEWGARGLLVSAPKDTGDVIAAGSMLLSHEVTGRVLRVRPGLDATLDAEVHRSLDRIERAASRPEPFGPAWSDVAMRALLVAALGFAAFAAVTHGFFGGGVMNPLALSSAVAVLASASIAAFGLAAPAARGIAVLRARAAGVLIKDVAALETLASVDIACFDKTGTVTTGARRVSGLSWINGASEDRSMLEAIAALEQASSHPIGRAIAAFLAARGVQPAALEPRTRVTESSNGVAGYVYGALVEVGSAARWGDPLHDADAAVGVVFFGKNGVPMGYFQLSDPLRPGAAIALRALWERGVGARLISGDRHEATVSAGHQLGVAGQGGLSPAEKVLAIRNLQLAGAKVALVGDGCSDASGAAQADVAVAIAPGTLPGHVSAPIMVSSGSLDELPALVDLARALRACLRQNAVIAVIYNALVIPAAAASVITPAAVAGLMLLETMIVLGNAARLLRAPMRTSGVASTTAAPGPRSMVRATVTGS